MFFLVSLIFAGTIGVSVFAHLCSVDGQELSYFAPAEDKCAPQPQEESCCHQNEETLDVSQDDTKFEGGKCCKENISYYRISTENADKILQLKFSPKYVNSFVLFPEIFPGIYVKEELIAFHDSGPPEKPYGKDLLIRNQVFRI